MKFIKASAMLGMAVAAAIASQQASAEDILGWYGGASVGRSKAKIADDRIRDQLLSSGFAMTGIDDDNRDTGYKIFAGYQMNRNFALEGGYFDLGKFGFNARTSPLGTLHGDAKVRGINLDLVGTLPLTEKFALIGRVGANYADVRDSFSSTGAVRVTNPNPSKKDTQLKYGLGLQYAFTERFAMRGEVERHRINDAVGNKGDIDLLSVGFIYRFGAKKSPPPQKAWVPEPVAEVKPAPAPAPVYVAPPPPPAAVVAPVPRVLKRVSFSADSLFDFDKSTIKPVAAGDLDKFIVELIGLNYVEIVVIGNTDRLGSAKYNQKLSERRADAVKKYLVDHGVPSDKISLIAAGETKPETKPDQCVGKKATKKLIACLQPDRRVDVDVKGTE